MPYERTEEWNRKALMPSCYTGRQEGIRTNLQGIDGRSQMQSAFPCLVHANAHDSWQCSAFEGQNCSLRKSFTSKEAQKKLQHALTFHGLVILIRFREVRELGSKVTSSGTANSR